MSADVLSMIMDGLVLLLLAVMIFYAVRLSVQLKAFRDSKKDIEKLLMDLSGHIVDADRAIAGLREAARDSGRDLQEKINDGRALSSELQLMSESGENIARRLEQAAARPKHAPRVPVPASAAAPPLSVKVPVAKSAAAPVTTRTPAFAIHDPEFIEAPGGGGGAAAVDEGADNGDEWDGAENLQSQAERELFAALRKGGVS